MEDKSVKELQRIIAEQRAEIFRLKSVIDNLPGSIYWKDKNGVHLGRNKHAAESMQSLGLETKSMGDYIIGKTDHEIFPKEVADRYKMNDLAVMESKQEMSIEEPITLENGKTFVRLSTKRPLFDEKGNVIGIVGNTVDITHLKEIEAELRAAKEKAEEANKAKTGFIRNVEHDIRTPFNGVLGMAHYLWQHETDPVKKEYLGDITQCAQELLDYCNGILDFSNIESGLCPIEEKEFNLQELIASALKIETPPAKNKNLSLKTHYDDHIPSRITGDSYRLYRILINLLSNAIKFTKKGYVELLASLVEKKDNQATIRLDIIDTGIGIPADKQEFIFEKFTRLVPSNLGAYKGIGLGLRIVKQFIEEMNGEITLASKENEGTRFTCTFPFKTTSN
jgi:PAS domain S-box-containing protein